MMHAGSPQISFDVYCPCTMSKQAKRADAVQKCTWWARTSTEIWQHACDGATE